jgi:valyl-tRNA synthetase
MPFADLVDVEKEKERLTKEKERLEKEIARGEGMLSNERFIGKAPAAKVEEERQKLKKYQETYAQVLEQLKSMGV